MNKSYLIAYFCVITFFFSFFNGADHKIQQDDSGKKTRKNELINRVKLNKIKKMFKTDIDNKLFEGPGVEKMLGELKSKIDKYSITIVLASWCKDCHQQLPVFRNILERIDYNEKKIKYIAVNEDKKVQDNSLKGIDFKRVPTFIIYLKGEEVGRIVETPTKSLLEDLLDIMQ